PSAILSQAAALTDRYWTQRQQPDKTLDLLDTALVTARQQQQDTLQISNLYATLSQLTGIQISIPGQINNNQFQTLRMALATCIIGQDQALDQVVTALSARQLRILNTSGPSVFLFVGDTGVGKTELAYALAEHALGDVTRIKRFNLGEHTGSEAVIHSLLGAPPGLIGSDRDGSLIAALRQPGEQILLFDELEKAHPVVQRMLLGILEQGIVTSAAGESLDARHCLFIVTSNAVTNQHLQRLGGIGFTCNNTPDIREQLTDNFAPEFLSRCDEIVIFQPLQTADLLRIIYKHLAKTIKNLAQTKLTSQINIDALADIILTQLETRNGARDVQRVVEKQILATILNHNMDQSFTTAI
ncbi:hypothetical protein TI03_05810, partial [Achromatium sp. WMS1]